MSDSSSDENGWNDRVEEQIINLGNLSLGYQWIHTQTAKLYSEKHKKFMWGSVITPNISGLSSLITTMNNSVMNNIYLQAISIFFAFASGIFSLIVEFGDYSGKAEEEKRAANKYMALSGNIQRQLNMYRSERQNGADYMEWISKSYEDLQESTPLLHNTILIMYAEISKDTGIIVPEAANMVIPMKYGIRRKKAIIIPTTISLDGCPAITPIKNSKDKKRCCERPRSINSANSSNGRFKRAMPDLSASDIKNSKNDDRVLNVVKRATNAFKGTIVKPSEIHIDDIEIENDLESGVGKSFGASVGVLSMENVKNSEDVSLSRVIDNGRMKYELFRLKNHGDSVSEPGGSSK